MDFKTYSPAHTETLTEEMQKTTLPSGNQYTMELTRDQIVNSYNGEGTIALVYTKNKEEMAG